MQTAIGIDIGGTKMALAAVDQSGAILARIALATEAERGFHRAVDRLSDAIRGVLLECEVAEKTLCGIGIGCAGPLDPLRGLINNPYTLSGWDKCDIVSPLAQRFGVPVRLENDADMAALGEYFRGAGQGFDPVVMLTYGTGIGGAAIVHGRVYRGARGEHPELGHVPTGLSNQPCYCGRAGCLEAVASGTAIAQAGESHGFADSREVFAAAQAGHAGAREIIDRAVAATAIAAWTLLHTLLPERIVLGGGIMDEHYELFAAPFRECIAATTMAPRDHISVAPARLGNDAGLVGAASAMFTNPGPGE